MPCLLSITAELAVLTVCPFQLKEVNRHPWVVAGGKGELDLEEPMMEVVQTHIIPGEASIDMDVVQVIFGNVLRCNSWAYINGSMQGVTNKYLLLLSLFRLVFMVFPPASHSTDLQSPALM